MRLSELRQQFSSVKLTPQSPDDFNGLMEISGPHGSGKLSHAVECLARKSPPRRLAWIESKRTLYPPALAQAGLALDHLMIIEAGGETLWATIEILRSHLFDAVFTQGYFAQIAQWRRLQLEAERARIPVFVFNETPQTQARWTLRLQITLQRDAQGVPCPRDLKEREKAWPRNAVA